VSITLSNLTPKKHQADCVRLVTYQTKRQFFGLVASRYMQWNRNIITHAGFLQSISPCVPAHAAVVVGKFATIKSGCLECKQKQAVLRG